MSSTERPSPFMWKKCSSVWNILVKQIINIIIIIKIIPFSILFSSWFLLLCTLTGEWDSDLSVTSWLNKVYINFLRRMRHAHQLFYIFCAGN